MLVLIHVWFFGFFKWDHFSGFLVWEIYQAVVLLSTHWISPQETSVYVLSRMISMTKISPKSVLEDAFSPHPFAMTLTSDLSAAHNHPLCVNILESFNLISVAALCDPVSTNECICI